MICRRLLCAGCLLAVLAGPTAAAAHPTVPVPGTYGDAVRWYRKAARAGDAKAQFYYALALEQGLLRARDGTTARDWFARSARGGFALAQLRLAQILQSEGGAPADLAAARRWYGAAADQGVAEARFNLALMLEAGEGGAADPGRAAALFEQTARAGIHVSLLRLGLIHGRGPAGGEPDLVAALAWFECAVRKGVDQARALRDLVMGQLSAAEQAEAIARAEVWLAAAPE